MSFLLIERIAKRFGDGTLALEDLTLEVQESEFVVLLGPSGCGKTTLLQIVAGLEMPTAGRLMLRGHPVRGWSRERTLVFQDNNLFPWLTARDNVAFGLRVQGLGPRERREVAHRTLGRLGLAGFEEHYPHQLSGGMQQRVAIARALAVDPELLLLDEPFASVDALTRSQLQQELLHTWQEYHKTVLFVTHNIREALLLADRIVILTPRPGQVKSCIHLDLPRPRQAHPLELSRWEQAIQAQIGAP